MTQVPFQYEIYYSDDKAFKQVLEEVNSSLSYIFDENDYAISLKNDMSVLSVESKLVTSAKILVSNNELCVILRLWHVQKLIVILWMKVNNVQ